MSREEVQLKIVIGDPEIEGEDYLYKITENLQKELSQLDLEAELGRGEEIQDAKGEPISIGALLVKIFSKDAISGFFNLIKNWLQGKRKNIEITTYKKTPEGVIESTTFKLSNTTMDSQETIDLVKTLKSEFK